MTNLPANRYQYKNGLAYAAANYLPPAAKRVYDLTMQSVPRQMEFLERQVLLFPQDTVDGVTKWMAVELGSNGGGCTLFDGEPTHTAYWTALAIAEEWNCELWLGLGDSVRIR